MKLVIPGFYDKWRPGGPIVREEILLLKGQRSTHINNMIPIGTTSLRDNPDDGSLTIVASYCREDFQNCNLRRRQRKPCIITRAHYIATHRSNNYI